MCDSFELQKVKHAKQAAYDEMAEVERKMSALLREVSEKTNEIDQHQSELDKLNEQKDNEWSDFSQAQLAIKSQIGDVFTSIDECNALKKKFELMANDESEVPGKAIVYAKGAEFFSRLASEKTIEKDQLITKKRAMMRPDHYSAKIHQLVEALKKLRQDRGDRLNDYHALKNELNLKKANFDRLNSKYLALKNGSSDGKTISFRPIKLKNDENKGLLLNAGIPEEFHETCTIKKRSDGIIDIYYGEDSETKHGHVIIKNGCIVYSRKPEAQKVTL